MMWLRPADAVAGLLRESAAMPRALVLLVVLAVPVEVLARLDSFLVYMQPTFQFLSTALLLRGLVPFALLLA
jgi:hypothetical protein